MEIRFSLYLMSNWWTLKNTNSYLYLCTTELFQPLHYWASWVMSRKLAQQLQVPLAMPEGLIMISALHILEEDNQLLQNICYVFRTCNRPLSVMNLFACDHLSISISLWYSLIVHRSKLKVISSNMLVISAFNIKHTILFHVSIKLMLQTF